MVLFQKNHIMQSFLRNGSFGVNYIFLFADLSAHYTCFTLCKPLSVAVRSCTLDGK